MTIPTTTSAPAADTAVLDPAVPASEAQAANRVQARLVKGFSAQAFGQAVNIIIQTGSVPLFLHFWGKPLYGEWLLLATIPSYFAMTDLGFASAAGTEMTMQIARGDKAGALRVFQSAWALVTFLSVVVIFLALAVAFFIPLATWLNLRLLNTSHLQFLVSVLIVQVFFSLQNGLIGIGYRCDGNYAIGGVVGSLKRLCEFSALATALLLGCGPLQLSLVYLATEITGNICIALDVRRRSPWLHYGIRHADRKTIAALAGPAISFMGFPLGNALSLQGVVTVIGITLGPAAVVLFATLRTLTRFVAQILGAVTNTVWVELSAAFGSGDLAMARRLHRRACQVSLWAALLLSGLLALVGHAIFLRWTGGKVPFDSVLFGLLLSVVVCNSLWSASYIVSVAANRHQQVALIYVLATGASLGLGFLLTHLMGVRGAALALLLIDMMMIAFVVPRSLKMLSDNLPDYVRAVCAPPLDLPRRLLRLRLYFGPA